MASIQQSYNSLFNAVLAAGLGGSHAIGQSKTLQKSKKLTQLGKEAVSATQRTDETIWQYAEEAEKGLERGEINKAQEEINAAGLAEEDILRQIVSLDPSPANIKALHDMSTLQGSIAIERQKQRINEIRNQKKGMKERSEILGGEN